MLKQKKKTLWSKKQTHAISEHEGDNYEEWKLIYFYLTTIKKMSFLLTSLFGKDQDLIGLMNFLRPSIR